MRQFPTPPSRRRLCFLFPIRFKYASTSEVCRGSLHDALQISTPPCNKGKMGVKSSRPRAQGGQFMKRKMANTVPVALACVFEKRLASYGMMSLAVAGAAVVAPAAKGDVIVFRTHGITTPRNGSI